MAKDGTNRGGRCVRAGDKPMSAVEKIQNDSMKNDEFYNFLLSAFKCMADHLGKGGYAYVFHADTEGLNFRKEFIDAGFHLAGCCIWVKDSLVLDAQIINGSMSLFCMALCRTASINGTLTESRPLYGILISRKETQTTPHQNRLTF